MGRDGAGIAGVRGGRGDPGRQAAASPFGWLFCGAALAQGFSALGFEYAVYTLAPPGNELAAGQWVFWLSSWLWVPHLAVIPIVLLLFPDGRLTSRRWGAPSDLCGSDCSVRWTGGSTAAGANRTW